MNSFFTLPALGASVLLAVAGGIQLGESTIAMINPVHFQGPAVHPRDRGAAVDEHAVRPSEPSFASLYGWDEGQAARAADCMDCDMLAARDAYVEYEAPAVSIYRGLAQEWEEPVLTSEADEGVGGPIEEVSEFDRELKERVVRYAYYEIEAEDEGEAGASWGDAE